MKKRIIFFCAVLGCALFCYASLFAAAGTTTADILKINQGARPAALAGAYTAIADDAYSINYNPSGLGLLKAPQLIILHSDHLQSISYEYFTFAFPVGRSFAAAANMTYRHTPPIDNNNEYPPATASDMLLSGTGAYRVNDQVRLGLTLKYLKSTLDVIKASTIAVDLGAQLDKLPYGLKAGFALQNIGGKLTFISEGESVPMFFRFGVGISRRIINRLVNADIDIFKPTDQGIKLAVGAEVWFFEKLFAARLGMKRESLSKDPGNVYHNLTMGFVLTRPISDNDIDLSVDFAYNPASFGFTVQDTYFFALNLKFNRLKLF